MGPFNINRMIIVAEDSEHYLSIVGLFYPSASVIIKLLGGIIRYSQ